MNSRQSIFLQAILEAAIPVYGYYVWNWNLSFILLFYLIDWILSICLFIAKGKKRIDFSGLEEEKRLLRSSLLIGIPLIILSASLFAFATKTVLPDLEWKKAIVDFLTYEEMGIQQGYVLIPLIVLNGVLLYRQQFVMFRRFEKLNMKDLSNAFIRQNLVLLAVAGLFFGLGSLVAIPEAAVVLVIVGGITVYRLVWLRLEIGSGQTK